MDSVAGEVIEYASLAEQLADVSKPVNFVCVKEWLWSGNGELGKGVLGVLTTNQGAQRYQVPGLPFALYHQHNPTQSVS